MGKSKLKLVALATMLALASSCAEEGLGEARFALEQCKRVALVDENRNLVIGAEDLALDVDGARIFVSAYNRRAAEKAAKKRKGAAPPSGGGSMTTRPATRAMGRIAARVHAPFAAAPPCTR